MSYPLKCKKLHITHDQVEAVVGPVIRTRPLKTISNAAGRTVETVKKWRTKLPESWVAFINLLANDDDAYAALMRLAGREDAPTLTPEQRRAAAELLKILGGN